MERRRGSLSAPRHWRPHRGRKAPAQAPDRPTSPSANPSDGALEDGWQPRVVTDGCTPTRPRQRCASSSGGAACTTKSDGCRRPHTSTCIKGCAGKRGYHRRRRYHRGDQRPRPRHTRPPAGVSATSMPAGGIQAAATTTVGVAAAFRGRSSRRRRSAMAECAVSTAAPQQPTGECVRRGAVAALDQMHGTRAVRATRAARDRECARWHERALRSRILS